MIQLKLNKYKEIDSFKLKLKSRKFKIRLSINGSKQEIKSTMSEDEFRELGLDPATMKKIFTALSE